MATRKKSGHTSNGRGTLLLERSFGGVSVRRASGAKSKDDLAEIVRILDALGKTGRLEVIRRVSDGRIKAIDLLHRSRLGLELDTASSAAGPSDRLASVGKRWLDGRRSASAGHRRSLTQHLALMLKRNSALGLSDIPRELIKLRQEYERAGHAVTYNNIRTSMLDLARWVEGGKRSTLWEEVRSIPKLKILRERQRAHNPFTPFRARLLLKQLNERAPGTGDIFFALCVTGMRPSEYFSRRWTVVPERAHIAIEGTKSAAARRVVPMLGVSYPVSEMSYFEFSKVFREAARAWIGVMADAAPLPFTLYDCRRSFAVWMEEAGIPRTRRRLYLGHAKADVTDLYEERSRKELRAAIVGDGERLATYLVTAVKEEKQRIDDEGARMYPQTKPPTPILWDDLKPA